MKIQRVVLTLHWCGALLVLGATIARPTSIHNTSASVVDLVSVSSLSSSSSASGGCFPSLGSWSPPRSVPNSVNGWWCDEKHEYAFLGFSYSVAACQSLEQLKSNFRDIRSRFQGRYVRLYGTCDRYGFYNDVTEAAWTAGLGIHALIWFGFTGGTEWMRRRDELFRVLHSNAKARFVTRAVQFGSEPLFDRVIDPYWLADEVNRAKRNLGAMGIKVTVSDLAYSYQREWNKGARQVLENVDVVDAHMLPFFSPQATTARNSWPLIMQDLDWFMKNSNGKKVYLSENGWPSSTSSSIQPNSPNAVANVRNEHDYYTLLDEHCSDFKRMTGGGVGWFAHIYSDSQEAGYGVYNQEGALKFPFRPRTEC